MHIVQDVSHPFCATITIQIKMELQAQFVQPEIPHEKTKFPIVESL